MHHNLSRRLFLGLSGASVLMSRAGFISIARAEDQVDEITWALPAINDTMFVPRAWSTYVGAIMSLVQEGLLAFADDLSLTAGVAEKWEQPDPTTYKYTLREGVKFGDGSDLTPDDVVASFQYNMNPKSGSQLAAFFSSVDSVTASGDREVTVKLKAPSVQFQYTPAHMAGFLFKKSQLEEFPEDIGTPEALPLGTGPYKLVEFTPADRVVLEARDDYWGPKPVAKKITFTAIPDR
jgi:peptide/nickel transport system substrate-binding protein